MSHPISRQTGRALLCAVGLAALSWTPARPAAAQVAVLTQNNDNARTGANTAETALTPSAVKNGKFGKLFTITGLNANVNGQVLYVPNLAIRGAKRNVVYAYTSNNSDGSPCGLYAYDADSGAQLWFKEFPDSATYTTATPVIDSTTNIIYVLTKSSSDDTGATYLHAIDIVSGQEKTGSPVQVTASVPGTGAGNVNGVVSFDGPAASGNRFHANDRAALLLVVGIVYLSFAHNTDSFPYHGWVLAYRYQNNQLSQQFVFCTTPNGGDGGVWQSGKGLTADKTGNLYLTVGNGTFDANTGGSDYGMCYLKLSRRLQVLDYFASHDEQSLSNQDLDTGNIGLVGIPGTTRLFGGATKFGTGFLVNSVHLGGFTPTAPDKALERLDHISPNDSVGQNPIAWDTGNNAFKYVYLWPHDANLEQFRYDPAAGAPDVNGQTGVISPAGIYRHTSNLNSGGSLAVSSNGATNGILWAVDNGGVLRAFAAQDISQPELWDSNINSGRDSLGSVGHFQFPTVVNGKVYVPTGSSSIAVYGLLK